MRSNDDSSLAGRLGRAADAKSALLEKFKRAAAPDNPEMIRKRQEREAIAAARVERQAGREAARLVEERERARAAEIAAAAAAEAARLAAEAAEREAVEAAERDAALKVEQKAARDARYAARKAAKKERRRGY